MVFRLSICSCVLSCSCCQILRDHHQKREGRISRTTHSVYMPLLQEAWIQLSLPFNCAEKNVSMKKCIYVYIYVYICGLHICIDYQRLKTRCKEHCQNNRLSYDIRRLIVKMVFVKCCVNIILDCYRLWVTVQNTVFYLNQLMKLFIQDFYCLLKCCKK